MKHLTFLAAAAFAGIFAVHADPLPSWNSSDSKKAIIAYVEKVSTVGSADFVPVEARIATLDNDGTLWSEAPLPPQAAFAFAEVERLLPENPEWKMIHPSRRC